MSKTHHVFDRVQPWLVVAVVFMSTIGIGQRASAAQPQLRGIWMHANFIKTRAEADRCVNLLDRANFNAVFLLVWYWGGQAAFQSPFCPMLEGVEAGYDPLGYMVQECHRRQIEVHAWFVNGFYGIASPGPVLDKHPEWAVDSGDKEAKLWYDLGQPAVRKFQSDLMIEALKTYDLDGLHFDYIRYESSVHCHCYCPHCPTEFTARHGLDPIDKKRVASFKETSFPKEWAEKWAQYRKWGVTELVRDVYQRAKSIKPKTQITAAVFARKASAEKVYQDWEGWLREGIIDYVIPMAYMAKTESLAAALQEWKAIDPELTRILPGLAIYSRAEKDKPLAARDLDLILTQYRLCIDQGARGANFFALDGTSAEPMLLLTDPLIDALRNGPFSGKTPAYRPVSPAATMKPRTE